MFTLPTFNITVEVRHRLEDGTYGDAFFSVAQLRGITKFGSAAGSGGPTAFTPLYALLLPSGTDVRDASNEAFSDQVFIDGFSGPLLVACVWDVAFGFDNEYRVAALTRRNVLTPNEWVTLPGQVRPPQP